MLKLPDTTHHSKWQRQNLTSGYSVKSHMWEFVDFRVRGCGLSKQVVRVSLIEMVA